MKRFIWVVPAILLFCFNAKAQETPWFELSGGYSYFQGDVASSPSFHMQGGYGSLRENMNSWFGGSFDFGAWGGTVDSTNISAQTYMFGPVFSYRRFDRVTPFANVEFGAIHGSEGYLDISQSAFKFAMTAGGGADFRFGSHYAVRGQADYLMSRFLNTRQDNLQYSVGLVFYIGNK
jgi:Outer membrane protein beta-barrel domain